MKKTKEFTDQLIKYKLTGKAIAHVKGGTATDDLWKWRKK